MPHIICTVTNDLTYDQRMIRICSSLVQQGHEVTLVGRRLAQSSPLASQPFLQKRLACFFNKGFLFYAEYNLRLFLWLLIQKADCICAIDLDTILPCLFTSKLKRIKRVYDAHELFCEMKEIVTRPSRYKIWKWIEQYAVPQFNYGYTVCEPIAKEFQRMYGAKYEVIRNVPLKRQKVKGLGYMEDGNQPSTLNLKPLTLNLQPSTCFIYQGAVNEGRSFETLIPAMKNVAAPLHIYGDGNFLHQTTQLIQQHHLQDKVLLKGKRTPEELTERTPHAYAGITLFENNGLSNYLSLANRFFDYIQAGIPQLCVDYPAYRAIQSQYETAVLIPDTSEASITAGLNLLLSDTVLYERLRSNCKIAAQELNWQKEEKILISFYKQLLG